MKESTAATFHRCHSGGFFLWITEQDFSGNLLRKSFASPDNSGISGSSHYAGAVAHS
jgi:hypothetical protein